MAVLYTIPNWFSGYDIIMEILFALVTALVAFYSFKIYALSQQREAKLFGVGFSLISLSYLLWAALNFSIMDRLNDGVTILDLEKLSRLNFFSIYLHIILFLLGLVTIAYMTLKSENKRLYLLIAVLAIVSVLGPFEIVYSFYLPAAALLLFIMTYYFRNYRETGNGRNLLVFFAFAFLLFSSLDFLFFENPRVQYVVAHCSNSLAYGLILADLILIMRGSKLSKRSKLSRAKLR